MVGRAKRTDRKSALLASSDGGHENVVTRLLDAGTRVDAADQREQTALMAASAHGHQGIVDLLLRAGAPVNGADELSRSALLLASVNGRYPAAVSLLQAGADVNMCSRDMLTPLMAACKAGDQRLVALLLAAGADVNAVDASHQTALTLASAGGHTDLVAQLLQAGATDSEPPLFGSERASDDDGICFIDGDPKATNLLQQRCRVKGELPPADSSASRVVFRCQKARERADPGDTLLRGLRGSWRFSPRHPPPIVAVGRLLGLLPVSCRRLCIARASSQPPPRAPPRSPVSWVLGTHLEHSGCEVASSVGFGSATTGGAGGEQ
eukprot:gene15834-24196_t